MSGDGKGSSILSVGVLSGFPVEKTDSEGVKGLVLKSHVRGFSGIIISTNMTIKRLAVKPKRKNQLNAVLHS